MKIIRLTPLLLLLLLVACYTTYYTRTFRLSTVDPGPKGFRPPDEVFTGPLDKAGPWDLGIRVISTYESNEKSVLKRDTFAVTITAESTDRPNQAPAIDTVYMTLVPSNKVSALGLERIVTDSVNYRPAIRYTFQFGNIRIPQGIDTVGVRFTVNSPGLAMPEGKELRFSMVRFEGKFTKLGVRPKGW